jgi:hypothetical protein
MNPALRKFQTPTLMNERNGRPTSERPRNLPLLAIPPTLRRPLDDSLSYPGPQHALAQGVRVILAVEFLVDDRCVGDAHNVSLYEAPVD